MRIVASCDRCRATFGGTFPDREAERVRAMAERFRENHLEGQPDHVVSIEETPPA